jgi:hypothetical protein
MIEVNNGVAGSTFFSEGIKKIRKIEKPKKTIARM